MAGGTARGIGGTLAGSKSFVVRSPANLNPDLVIFSVSSQVDVVVRVRHGVGFPTLVHDLLFAEESSLFLRRVLIPSTLRLMVIEDDVRQVHIEVPGRPDPQTEV